MADPECLAKVKDVAAWNRWRRDNPKAPRPDFGRADLRRAILEEANLTRANLREAALRGANLTRADLTGADLTGANLRGANLTRADLRRAELTRADLTWANLTRADLRQADLTRALCVGTTIDAANLSGCRVYGISAWDVSSADTVQQGLVITSENETAAVTVDNLEVAQFIYLMLHNKNLRAVIDTITSKVVLILGRFTDERKAVLDALRDTLRTRRLTPVLFDFTKPATKDVTGTVETLARMARFVVADLTDPSSIPYELALIVPFLRTTPVVLLRLAGTTGFTMVKDLEAYQGWVIPVREYPNPAALVVGIDDYVIRPAEARLKVLRPAE